MAIHGWSGDCQSNSGVRGYSDMGGGGGGGGIAVAIHGWSGDCQSNSGVRRYSDIGGGGGGGGGGYSSGYPWMVRGLSE